MTPKELAKQLTFKEVTITHHETLIHAELKVFAEITYDTDAIKRVGQQAKNDMCEQLTYSIHRQIYGDKINDLVPLVMELIKCSPLDYIGLDKAKTNLLRWVRQTERV